MEIITVSTILLIILCSIMIISILYAKGDISKLPKVIQYLFLPGFRILYLFGKKPNINPTINKSNTLIKFSNILLKLVFIIFCGISLLLFFVKIWNSDLELLSKIFFMLFGGLFMGLLPLFVNSIIDYYFSYFFKYPYEHSINPFKSTIRKILRFENKTKNIL